MKIYILLIVAIIIIAYTSPVAAQPHGGWKQTDSTNGITSSKHQLIQGVGHNSAWYMRTTYTAVAQQETVIWAKGGFKNIPFQSKLLLWARADTKPPDSGLGYFSIRLFYHGLVTESPSPTFPIFPAHDSVWHGRIYMVWQGDSLTRFDSIAFIHTWSQFAADPTPVTIDLDDLAVVVDGDTIVFYSIDWGWVAGLVFNDSTGNGSRDSDEVGLANWKVFLVDTAATKVDSASTDSTGQFRFNRVPHGTYSIEQEVLSGWRQTTPLDTPFVTIDLDTLEVQGITFGNTFEITVVTNVNARWNMVSVPIVVQDGRKDTLYPTAISAAYTYTGSSYVVRDTLTHGVGYWLKFSSSQTVSFAGREVAHDTIPVQAGWNLIGSTTHPLAASELGSTTPGMALSQVFGYSGTYAVVDSLRPGTGYWIKTNLTGQLTFGSSGTNAPQQRLVADVSELPPPPDGATPAALPSTFSLKQNYPNPFNPTTHIAYELPRAGLVSLKVYNILGQEVTALVDGEQAAGRYTARWNAAAVPSGVYIYRLQAGGYREVKKMVLLR